jgi:hypothetical protein
LKHTGIPGLYFKSHAAHLSTHLKLEKPVLSRQKNVQQDKSNILAIIIQVPGFGKLNQLPMNITT